MTEQTPAPARRFSAPSWTDLRLWLGLLLVAGSVIVGSALLRQADDTVAVWALARDVAPGETLVVEDLVAHRVRFADPSGLTPYFTSEQTLPSDLTVGQALSAGQLLPRTALGGELGAGLAQVPLQVEVGALPPAVQTGSVVDVWIAAERNNVALLALRGVPVISVSAVDAEFDPGAPRQLVLGIEAERTEQVAELLGAARDGAITVVLKER